jgi:hypothetical protein
MSTLKKVSCRTYFFQKLTQFSQGYNVLDAPGSNTDRFLSRDTCVSSLSCIDLFGTKGVYLDLEKPKLLEVFL